MNSPCIYLKNKPGKSGYIRIRVEGKRYYAHRHYYELNVGKLTEGMEIDHLCKNRSCVNTNHLEQVTPTINKRRSTCPSGINYNKTHCIKGHEFNKENTYLHMNERHCIVCKKITNREHYLKSKTV